MIDTTVEKMASNLQNVLNKGFNYTGIDNTRFEFAIFPEAGTYKAPIRDGNMVTYYINGIMRIIGSQIEGTEIVNYNALISTAVELLVPVIQGSNDEFNERFVAHVRAHINEKLAFNENITEKDQNNPEENHFVGIEYKVAQTGTREVLPKVGDCVKLTLYINYMFVAHGISSNTIKVSIGETQESLTPLYFTNLGISRRSLTEGNITNDSGCVSKAAVSGTAFVINAAMPLRNTAIDKKLINFSLDPNIEDQFVVNVNFTAVGIKKDYEMTISSCNINGELGLNASVSFELVEVL